MEEIHIKTCFYHSLLLRCFQITLNIGGFLWQMLCKFIRIKSCLRAYDPCWECRPEVGEEVITEWWFDYWNFGNRALLWEQNVPFVCLLEVLEYFMENSSFNIVPNILLLKWPILLPCNIVWNISLHSSWNFLRNSFTFSLAKNYFSKMKTTLSINNLMF